MLKLFKILSSLVIFILLALLAIPFFVDVNDYKPEIKQAVFDATGRQLDIEHIKLSLFPWVGITLKNARLENAPEFEQPYMLSVKSIDVQVELMPLFNKEVEIKRFELDTPIVWLTQKEDGRNNWSSVSQTSAQAAVQNPQSPPTANSTDTENTQAPQQKTPAQASSLPLAFKAKLLQLNHGQIIWSDKSKGDIHLNDITLAITDLQLQQPITLDLSAKVGNDNINMHAKVGPVLDLAKLDLAKLPILAQLTSNKLNLAPFAPWLPQLEAEQEQQFGMMSDTNLNMDISVEQHADAMILSTGSLQIQNKNTLKTSWKLNSHALKSVQLQTFKLGIDDVDVLSMSGKIKSLKNHPRFEASIETSKLQRIWLNKFVPSLEELYKNHPKPWQSIKLATFIAGDADIIEIRNLQLEMDDEPLQISGDIALGKAPDIQLRITTNALHLDPWIPQGNHDKTAAPSTQATPPTSANGTATEQTSTSQPVPSTIPEEIEPDLTFLKSWYLSVQLHAKAIHVMTLQLDQLRMTLSAEKGVVRLNPLSFAIEDGKVTENLTLYANQYPVTWSESVRMTGISVQPILKAVADFDQLSGITQLNTDLTGSGLLPHNIIRSLKGRGNFLFEDGQFKGVDIAKSIRKLTKAEPQEQSSTDFAQMQGSFNISDAILTNNDLYMASPLFRLTGKGKLFLEPLAIDYQVRPRLIQSLQGQGGDAIKKGVVVPLHISGPFDNLDISVQMDKASVLESAAAINAASGNKIGGVGGQILDQGFVKTREEQKQKLAEKLALEKEKAREKAQQQVKDKLQNAFKGFKF